MEDTTETRDRWLIQMNPCEASLEAYQDLCIRTASSMRGRSRQCELYDHCPMVRAEREAKDSANSMNLMGGNGQRAKNPKQLRYSGNARGDKKLQAERRNLLIELKGKRREQRPSLCIRKIAQHLAQEIVLVGMIDMRMTFEQAVEDAIISCAQMHRGRKFKIFNGHSWEEYKGADQVMDKIVQFAMLIIGFNGSEP